MLAASSAPAVAPPMPGPAALAAADAPAALHRGRYRRVYRITGEHADCLLQRVQVRIRYLCGGRPWAAYRQTYFEFFRFERGEDHAFDVHDFDLTRDGWRQAVVVGLVRRHLAAGSAGPAGEAALEVHKSFLLAPGAVHGAAPRPIAGGAQFGLLAAGPGGPSRAELRIARGDGTTAAVAGIAACPGGFPVAGEGRFTARHGFRACERFRYRFADLAGAFADRGGYRAAGVPSAPASPE